MNRTSPSEASLTSSAAIRQNLPIVERGSPGDIVNACVTRSHIWEKHVMSFLLKENSFVPEKEMHHGINFSLTLDQKTLMMKREPYSSQQFSPTGATSSVKSTDLLFFLKILMFSRRNRLGSYLKRRPYQLNSIGDAASRFTFEKRNHSYASAESRCNQWV